MSIRGVDVLTNRSLLFATVLSSTGGLLAHLNSDRTEDANLFLFQNKHFFKKTVGDLHLLFEDIYKPPTVFIITEIIDMIVLKRITEEEENLRIITYYSCGFRKEP